MSESPSKEYFEVETLFSYGWENCWEEEVNNDEYQPQQFRTQQQAKDAIDSFFADLRRARMDHNYDRNEYRVVRKVESGAGNK